MFHSAARFDLYRSTVPRERAPHARQRMYIWCVPLYSALPPQNG